MNKNKIFDFVRNKKPNFISKLFYFARIAFLAVPVLFLVFGNEAKAGTAYNPDQVNVKVDVEKGTQNLFYRVHPGSTVNLKVDILLDAPSSLIAGDTGIGLTEVDSDTLNIGGLGGDASIGGFYVGAIEKESSKTSCEPKFITNGIKCNFPVTAPLKNNVTLTKNSPLSFNLSIPVSRLGITQGASTPIRKEVYVYPVIKLGIVADLIFKDSGKSVYFEVYENQSQVDQHATDPIPGDIPGNGTSVSGSADFATGGLAEFLARVFVILLGYINEFIFWLFGKIVVPFLQAFLSIRTYTDAFSNIIYPGWEILRNLANIFFIVALIFIALATLFRLPNYNFRHMLVDIIIAALLVNFSLVIGQAILGVADTVQNQFLPNNSKVINKLAETLMVDNFRNLAFDPDLTKTAKYGAGATFVQALFLCSVSLVTLIVFIAIAGFIALRIVMLWILLMLSPIPYFAKVLPFTEEFTGKWWGYFIRYAFFTPIMAFFLNMAAIIAEQYPQLTQTLVANQSLIASGSEYPLLSAFLLKFLANFLLLVFLFIGIEVADEFSIIGGGIASTFAEGAATLPFLTTAAGATFLGKDVAGRYGYRKYNEWTQTLAEDKSTGLTGTAKRTAYRLMHPIAQFKAFRHDSEELMEQSEEFKKAASLSLKRQVAFFGRPGEDPLALYQEHAGKEAYERLRGESSGSEQDEVAFGKELVKKALKGDKDAKLALPEHLKTMFKNHNHNEFVEMMGPMMKEVFKKNGVNVSDLDERAIKYNTDNFAGMLNEFAKAGILSDEINVDLQKRMGNIAYSNGDLSGAEMTYNDDEGEAHVIEREFDDVKKSFVVVGKDLYEDAHAYANSIAKTNEEYAQIMSDVLKGNDSRGHFSGAKSAMASAGHAYDKKKFMNAYMSQAKIMEKQINYSKMEKIQQLKQWWENVVTYVPKQGIDGSGTDAGKAIFNGTGKDLFTKLDRDYFWLASRGNISDKIMKPYQQMIMENVDAVSGAVTGGRDRFREQLELAIKEKAKYNNQKLDAAALAKEVDIAEYNNLAMLYSAKTGKVGDLDVKINMADATQTGLQADVHDSAQLKEAVRRMRVALSKKIT